MKKQITTLAFTITSLCSLTVYAQNSFTGFTRSIQHTAGTWITDTVSPLSQEDQLTVLNFFAGLTTDSIETTLKCLQTMQATPELENTLKQLGQNFEELIRKYIDIMNEKFEQRIKEQTKDGKAMPSEAAVQEFWQKLEQKIQELATYFYQLYYEKLYVHLATEDATRLTFMFDENGIIAPEKRTRLLPSPTV